MRRHEPIDGVLVVDKPAGPTSHDIVQQVRRITGARIGHTGTLDPAATGVLVLVLGRATRLSSLLTASDKEYLASVRLGRVTDTYDAEGETVEEHAVPDFPRSEIEAVLERFRGTIEQVPPMFSAIKIDGEPLYRAARRQEVRERPSRTVTLSSLELLDWSGSHIALRVVCSAGTYVRSLAHDMGQRLGCGAVLESLRRTRSGIFRIEESIALETLPSVWKQRLIPVADLLPDLPERVLTLEEAQAAVHGNPVKDPGCGGGLEEALWRLTYGGDLLALADLREGAFRPRIVLCTELAE